MNPDVIIIGGGIVGCAAAWELAQAGLCVHLFERAGLGAEASQVAAGVLGPLTEFRCPQPFLELCRDAMWHYPQFIAMVQEESRSEVGYIDSGLLCVAFSEQDEQALAERHTILQSLDFHIQEVDVSIIRELEPHMATPVRRGLYLPDYHQVDPTKLIPALACACEQRGVRFHLGESCVALLRTKDKVTGIKTEQGSYEAPYVINASGAWTPFVQDMPCTVPVTPVRGQIVIVETVPHSLKRITHSPQAYLVPRSDGRVLIGSTVEHVGFHPDVTAEGITQLLQGAQSLFPHLQQAVFRKAWAGLRPWAPDHLPVIGTTPLSGFLLATAHFRNGILLAPLTAKLLRQLVVGDTPAHASFAALNVERFAEAHTILHA